MRCCSWLLFLPLLASGLILKDLPPSLSSRRRGEESSTQLGAGNAGDIKPTLVVGATGKVGRRVVQQLLEKRVPVRALVRDAEKAEQIFGKETSDLEFVVADLSHYEDYKAELDAAVNGSSSVISVSGTMRFSKVSDFLPWRLLNGNVPDWSDDKSHPFYVNYKAQCFLIDLAKSHNVDRFVRLTGLSTGSSPFSLVSMIFSSILSITTRYHFLAEQYLRNSGVPHAILRPGGLSNEARDPAKAFLQVDPSCRAIPPPARVSRDDVAALAIASCTMIPRSESYTFGIRSVGEVSPKAQGTKEEGCETAEECIQKQILDVPGSSETSAAMTMSPEEIQKKSRTYGISVGLFTYSFFAISLTLVFTILSKIGGLLFR